MGYEELIKGLLNSREKVSNDCNLTKETVDQLLNSIDSAWDQKVFKYVLASTRSRTEFENLGIGDRISRTVEEVSKGILERKKYFQLHLMKLMSYFKTYNKA